MDSLPGLTKLWTQVARAGCCCIAILFLFTASTKLNNVHEFAATVRAHAVVPSDAIPVLAWAVPLGEVVLAAFALRDVAALGRVRRPLMLFAVALAVFAAYAAVLSMNPPVVKASCGCGFSRLPVDSWLQICLRNGLLALACTMARLIVPMSAGEDASTSLAKLERPPVGAK